MSRKQIFFSLISILILLAGVFLSLRFQLLSSPQPHTGDVLGDNEFMVDAQKIRQRDKPKTDGLIVKFKDGVSEEQKKTAILASGAKVTDENIDQLNSSVVDIPKGKNIANISQKLEKTGLVADTEPDAWVYPALTPNDPLLSSQWHHSMIGSQTAWDTATGQDIVVAIADTGINCSHPDISGRCIHGWNFYNDSPDITDVQGHGTLVAGTAAAIGNNSNQGAGVAYNVYLMPVKISDDSGLALVSDIIEGIVYAADNGAKVVNVSFGPLAGYSSIENAAQYAEAKGCKVVIAMGNESTRYTTTSTPTPIFVSSTTSSDALSYFSNYGNPTDVAAPGSSIYTTNSSGGMSYASGTSFSAPIVAGIVGLLYHLSSTFTTTQVESFIEDGTADLGSAGWDESFGWGRVSASGAISEALTYLGNIDTAAPTTPTGLTYTTSETNVSLSWSASTDNVAVTGYKIYRNSTQVGTAATTNYTDTTALQGPTYSYTVSAYDAAGNESSPSSAVSVNFPDTTAPSTPGNFRASTEHDKVKLFWDPSSDNAGIDYYNIYKYENSGWQRIDTPTITGLNDFGVRQGTSYRYRIIAQDYGGNQSGSSELSILFPDTAGPSTPTLRAEIHSSYKGVDLKWELVSDNVQVDRYHLYRDGSEVNNIGGHLNIVVDSSVEAGKTYHYKLKARDIYWNYSAQSNEVEVKIPANITITSVSVTNFTSTTATIVWQTNVKSKGPLSYGSRNLKSIVASAWNSVLSRFAISANLPYEINDRNPTTYHQIDLVGLKSKTSYAFQINAESDEKPGDSSLSEIYFFKTK